MAKKIVFTSPADGWFLFQKNKSDRDPYNFFRLAAWATFEDGETVGLLSICKKGTFYLDTPPEGADGGYIHWDELNSDQQKEALLQGKIVGTTHPASFK